MDWGGISFELDRAAAVDFVQEALIVSSPEPDVPGQPPKDESEQRAWSMGQLSGKFTVMPNWDQML
jgi:DNA-directed RNA polymerase III subunit RPC4